MSKLYPIAWTLAVFAASIGSGVLHTAGYKSAGIAVAALMLGAVGAAADIARRDRDEARAELAKKEEGK